MNRYEKYLWRTLYPRYRQERRRFVKALSMFRYWVKAERGHDSYSLARYRALAGVRDNADRQFQAERASVLWLCDWVGLHGLCARGHRTWAPGPYDWTYDRRDFYLGIRKPSFEEKQWEEQKAREHDAYDEGDPWGAGTCVDCGSAMTIDEDTDLCGDCWQSRYGDPEDFGDEYAWEDE